MASIPTSFNPSDYQYLLKSIIEGNIMAKGQSLKRFNTLITTDRKQFAIYAKRIVLAIQDLLLEQREEINLLATNLTLEIITLNPKQIEYYIRTKLLKHIVTNLGDSKPQIRKTSHYCLLGYVKTYRSFDEIINVYIDAGINASQAQLRQKCINSFQSIMITEIKYLNWATLEFKKLFELLLQKLKDQNTFVQKAAEQCLLSISRMEQIRNFSKKLSPATHNLFRLFCQSQNQLENLSNLHQIKQDNDRSSSLNKIERSNTHINLVNESHRHLNNTGQSLVNLDKINLIRQDSMNKKAIIDRIQEIRRNSQTPKIDQDTSKTFMKKVESMNLQSSTKEKKDKQKEKQKEKYSQKTQTILGEADQRNSLNDRTSLQTPMKRQNQSNNYSSSKSLNPVIFPSKQEKIENVLGKKILEDLKNQKDWKIRLQAIQQLQTKFEIYKQAFDVESLMKNFVPILIKLLADPNFKIALIALKIIEQILKLPLIKLEAIVPQIVEKLSDNKIALRQNVSKLIRSEYLSKGQDAWIDSLIDQLNRAGNNNTRQQILNILTKLYEEKPIKYSLVHIVEAICPLMQDLKTKIKIRTLDLLVLITVKTQKVDTIKSILMGQVNQVYYQMYLEKIGKELKSHRISQVVVQDIGIEDSKVKVEKDRRVLAFPSLKHSKNSPTNTTSTSLQKYSKTTETKPVSKASSFIQKSRDTASDLNIHRAQRIQTLSSRNLLSDQDLSDIQATNRTPSESIRKRAVLKPNRRKLQKTFQSKMMTNYSQNETLRPFNDPQRELRTIATEMRSQDWQTCYDSLTKLRRIIHNHQQFLIPSVIRPIIPSIMSHAQSLRSSLSKNGVITMNDLANTMKKNLDPELELIFNKLIKKTLDANSFISDEVKKALVSICSNCNENKVMSLLTSSHTSRAIPIKQVVVHILESIAFLPRVYEKELERMVQILVDFMGEGSLEIREKTKVLLNKVIQNQKSNPSLLKLIPTEYLSKLKIIEQKSIQKQKPEELPAIKKEIVHQDSTLSLRKKRKPKILTFPAEFNELQGFFEKSQASDWKVRVQGMNQIHKLCKEFPQQATQHRLNSRIIDILSKQINDPNVKVGINALNVYKDVVNIMPQLIENNLSVILNEIFNCFASQKAEIRELSQDLFDQIAQKVEKWMLLQHLCNGINYSIPKSKALILQKLIKILPQCFKSKPSIIQKSLYPMINKTAEENKPDLQSHLKELIALCFELCGDEVFTYLKPKARALINE